MFNGRRQPSCDGTSRISREAYVRFCERRRVRFPGLLGQNENPPFWGLCQLSPAADNGDGALVEQVGRRPPARHRYFNVGSGMPWG